MPFFNYRFRFDIIKKLGQGTYGKVQLGINKETSQDVAIKTIKKCKIETEADLVRIRREVQIMSSVQHPNIIHIYEGASLAFLFNFHNFNQFNSMTLVSTTFIFVSFRLFSLLRFVCGFLFRSVWKSRKNGVGDGICGWWWAVWLLIWTKSINRRRSATNFSTNCHSCVLLSQA